MKIECTNCKKEIERHPKVVRLKNFCDSNCKFNYSYIIKKCCICNTEFTRYRCYSSPTPLCSKLCQKQWQSNHMSELNQKLNPDRMTLENRLKVREGRLKVVTAKPKTYKKYLGKHIHRILAEEKLGRKLKKGEVVHHIDGNPHNNSFDNLEVLKNQSEHLTLHNLIRYAD